METIEFSIAKEFSETPGGRYWKDFSPFSGEEFYQTKLLPLFLKAQKENKQIVIDLNGTYGYASSFLDESFGKLVRVYGINEIKNILSFRSYLNTIVEDINFIMEKAQSEYLKKEKRNED
nr:STAS-like domain-containing protein [Parabacteroides goldsteinii]